MGVSSTLRGAGVVLVRGPGDAGGPGMGRHSVGVPMATPGLIRWSHSLRCRV